MLDDLAGTLTGQVLHNLHAQSINDISKQDVRHTDQWKTIQVETNNPLSHEFYGREVYLKDKLICGRKRATLGKDN